jgi:hypothetical protein
VAAQRGEGGTTMPGPAPKHASVRARRNKTSTAATLSAARTVEAPQLPAATDWHPMTVAWWRDIWASPMAPEFEKSDKHGLFILATLVNAFWEDPSKELASEIRLQRQAFGLTPMDRRRLQWEIERVDEAQDRGERRRTSTPKKPPADPRGGLYAV